MLDWDQCDPRPVDAATGACLFLRRSALADVGPFDERFFVYYEETDWLIRAKRRGWRTVFLPGVEAMHASGSSSPGVRSGRSLLLLESQHRYARKHFGPVTAVLLRSALAGLDAARLVRHAGAGGAERRAQARDRIRVHVTMRAPGPPEPRWTSPSQARRRRIDAAEWRRLAERAGHVFATREWLLTWWRQSAERRPAHGRRRPGRRRGGRHRAARCVVGARPACPALRRPRPERPARPDLRAGSRSGGGRRRRRGDRRHPSAALRAAGRARSRRRGLRRAHRRPPALPRAEPGAAVRARHVGRAPAGAGAKLPPAGAPLPAQARRARSGVLPPRRRPRPAPA